jgi:ABC-type uncharacterized transport system permease subunit
VGTAKAPAHVHFGLGVFVVGLGVFVVGLAVLGFELRA